MLFDNFPAAVRDVFGFGPIETATLDRLFELLAGFGRELVCVPKLLEEVGRDFIDSGVGALRGEDCGDKQLK